MKLNYEVIYITTFGVIESHRCVLSLGVYRTSTLIESLQECVLVELNLFN